ncbi:tRNA (uridine(54)-C5)-methyltransferase TrmA [Neiella marina]|uniref:tRNA/tmRNA (uracil-C(5))-methyltransferase n=1 Tax=Neiella holothuriorum TaxID=2870530 RepID=A0ABS7EHA1_9GAMM|nr:tRNA (uridine(54)-C5)-methyltransferase TrmA [Neiella holothuriorum]MBW8191273.1 tRNA (uridine(54)-C5)-methyltransferase TrmA [Neiella holothuriorum]
MSDHVSYQQQLDEKVARLSAQFTEFGNVPMAVFESPAQYYRMRAEFRVWHEGEELYHIMFDQQSKQKYRVDQFETASTLINQAMPLLISLLKDNEVLRRKLFQVDYLSSQQGELLISLLYHKQLDDEWQAQAELLQQQLRAHFPTFIVGRARKQKLILDRDYVNETLQVNGRDYLYRHVENSFTQPNAKVCEHMLNWAQDCTANIDGDLLELYCGNGNFSIPLAANFRKVLATEIAKPSVDSAQHNIASNGVSNLDILRLSSEEFTQAWRGDRKFRRLEGIDLPSYQLDTLFVDPPRAGLDEQTREMAMNFKQVLYISCNPDTLYRDLQRLSDRYQVEKLALFDQFPFTHHAEMGVWLTAK